MSPPAISPFSLNPLSPTSSALPSSLSLSFSNPNPHTHAIYSFRSFKFKLSCSHQTIQLDIQQINPAQKKRKPRPSFLEQIQDKWSVKTISLREKLPWEEGEERESFEEEEDNVEKQSQQFDDLVVSESRIVKNSSVSDPACVASANRLNLSPSSVSNPVSVGSAKRINLAPWVQRNKPRNTQNDFEARNIEISSGRGKRVDIIWNDNVQESKNLGKELKQDENFEEVDDKVEAIPTGLYKKKENLPVKVNDGLSNKGKLWSIDEEIHNFADSRDECNSMRLTLDRGIDVKSVEKDRLRKMLPWERESDVNSMEGDNLRKSNTMVAEKMIPEPELKRLRNVALRMVERIKVKVAGITQALVDSIHEKWKNDEVVKLKFEGPTAMNMKRSHEILERRTGGLVIWRSGSSMVLFRGMAYKLHCVKSFSNQQQANIVLSQPPNNLMNEFSQSVGHDGSDNSLASSTPDSATYMKGLSQEELMNLSELNFLLDELGPRFIDWAGRDPLPVDADLLPSLVPGYKCPFRLLPYGIRPVLRNKEMTFIRRTARTMPPHFALGRNRELQGLAMAMVNLWERSAIAKIAIKRGVHNTCNERMAEELKRLTGGTLVSRNKDYIVFYRGNDFLPPGVTKTLVQAQNLAAVRQDEEDKARLKALALMDSNAKASKGPTLVAGTLAETMAATSRWGNQPSGEEREKMMRDLALARHASLVRFLEKKLALANGKVKKAEKALRKVQDYLEPALLPTDLETLTDEERFLFRKIGLSMKPFLLLGRRGIFDGTIENMHLHWKYRELVKIIVDGKKFSQVKHIAIALEAESGGVLVSVDKTTKGYSIIVYRGKNYQRPCAVRPKNLLTKRQALARSIELQRREALKYHISELQEKIEKLKIELENMTTVNRIYEETFYSRVDDDSDDGDEGDDDNIEEDEDEEAYLEIYDSGDEDGNT